MRFVYSLIVAIARGIQYAILEKLLVQMPIAVMCFFSTLFNLFFRTCVMYFGKYNFNIKKYLHDKNTLLFFVVVTVLFLCANALILFAIKSKNATVASLIEITYPIFVIIFSFIFFRSVHINRQTAIGGTLILWWIALVYIFNK